MGGTAAHNCQTSQRKNIMNDKEDSTPNTAAENDFAANFQNISVSLAVLRQTIESLKPPGTGTLENLELRRQWNVMRGHLQRAAQYWDTRIARNTDASRMWKNYEAMQRALAAAVAAEQQAAQSTPEVEHAAE